MTRTFARPIIILVLAAGLMALAVATVSAAQSPAQNQPACNAVGGEFTRNINNGAGGSANECVVSESEPAGFLNGWILTTRTTYTWEQGNVSDVDVVQTCRGALTGIQYPLGFCF